MKENPITLLKVFNYVGAALVFFGIAFFISLNWFSLNTFLKIFSTLGSAIAAYLVGMFFLLDKRHEAAGTAFFMIAALTLPIGLYVTIDELRGIGNITCVNAFISALCFLVFLASQALYPRMVFLLFSVIFGSLFYLNLIDLIMDQSLTAFHHLTEYEFLSLGLSYLFLGRYLDIDGRFSLVGPLYFFGGLYVLCSSYSLGGTFCFGTDGSALWKTITALLILSSFILAVPLKSKALLYLGAIFLVLYLTDMSSRFIDIFGHYGWPLVLILVGFLFMFTGYLVMNIRRKITRDKTES